MIFIYRLLSALAALLVIIIGGSWLAHKYEFGPDVGWWVKPYWLGQQHTDIKDDGIPAELPGDVSVSIDSHFNRNAWERAGQQSVVLPVLFGRAGFFGFNRWSYMGGATHRSGGSCFEKTVNLLVIGDESAGEPMYKHRVFLPYYAYFNEDAGESIATLVIDNDSNGDNKLDCGDEARFEIRSLSTDEIRTSTRTFIPDNLSQINYHSRDDQFTFVQVEYADNSIAALKTISVARQSLEITETRAPDLTTKAAAAFNKIGAN